MTTTTLSAAELEMKLMVTKTLEAQGVLSHIKAQLRAAVIKALHDTSPSPSISKAHLLKSTETHLALCVIAEFLRQMDLHETLSVLSAEVESPLLMDRRTLAKEIGVPDASEKIALLLTALAPRAPSSVKDPPKTTSATMSERDDDEPAPSFFSAMQKQSLPVRSAEPLGRSLDDAKAATTVLKNEDDDDEVESEVEVSIGDVSESFEDSSASRDPPKATEQPKPSPATLETSDDEYTFISQATPQSRMSSLPPVASSQSRGRYDADEDKDDDKDDDDDEKPSVARPTVTSATARDDDDDEGNAADEEARLSSLDATLKAMEAEDETGTLKQLKATLQHELDVKSDDDQYGSDFEEDFDAEEDIASDVEDDMDASVAESQDESFQAPASDKRVRSTDVLDDYDYVETVQKP
ncbi:hypothetical protein, variant [Saprolegnia diclina VS20]|uniref:Uncharacterized protein n=1 Tax=Saprolegnia diclina (strain VS20) TaxID=1156394 RepID=T0QE29_SAPDV|nr:hypothetical protein, variant [Saprolegnia diclina VS20]EQC36154.1 hypothetical protein, variant [Saprolegnia diclina VS20]|eukprot:XP_008610260.1 hypothetical protein, variant [Saprolegnia diclina VS20]